jgi:hypothetical protein
MAQVGIGNTNPEALLDLTSTVNGVLLPRVSLTSLTVESPILNPQTGDIPESTLVFHDGSNGIESGFYYWTSTSWRVLQSGENNNWQLTGNSGINSIDNFLGTKDPDDLVIKTAGIERARILSTGNFGIGTNSPSSLLEVTGSAANLPVVHAIQTNTSLGSHAVKGEGIYGPTKGYLGVQGNSAFDGTTWNLGTREIGVLGISEGSTPSDNVGIMGLSNGIGVMGISTIDIGTYGYSTTSFGLYGGTTGANVQGVFSYNSNAQGTGVLGVGNNTSGLYLSDGSGGAFTGTGTGLVTLARTDITGNGIISSGSNKDWWTLGNGSGVAATGFYGVYGRSEDSNGAGIVGQNTSTGWTGDFQGPMRAGVSTSDRHDFYGWWQSGSASDDHRINPASGNWGFVGDPTYYWYYMYSNNLINVSRRETKRDIVPIAGAKMMEEIVMSDLDLIQPSFYKYNCESDIFTEGNEAKFRANKHLGVILDEAPDYLKDNAFTGIDVYAVGVMALAAAKYNRKEIQKVSKSVSDFGVGKSNLSTLFIHFSKDFKHDKQGNTPVITVTAMHPKASLYISEITNEGFRVVSETQSSLMFNWIAMAKVDLKTSISKLEIDAYKRSNELSVSIEAKNQMRQWVASEKEENDQKGILQSPAEVTESMLHRSAQVKPIMTSQISNIDQQN